jgi:hypothetical protein
MRRLTAIDLRDIARACRAMAYRAEKDAERQGTSSSVQGFRDEQKRFTEYSEELERLAKERS